MSSINLINKDNSPTHIILNDTLKRHGMDILRKYRFEVGSIDKTYQATLFLLQEAYKLEDENIREFVIENSLKTIKKL